MALQHQNHYRFISIFSRLKFYIKTGGNRVKAHRDTTVFYIIKRILFFTIPLGCSTLCPPASFAATATNTLSVTASVDASCSVGAATLAFGAYAPTADTALTGSASIPVTCTEGTAFQLGLDTGLYTADATSGTTRAMKGSSGAYYLSYELYQDTSDTTIWGDTPTTEPMSVNGTGSAVDLTVYGRIPAGQTTALPDNLYSDTVTATVTY
jgi:spore coat protein U-like protein